MARVQAILSPLADLSAQAWTSFEEQFPDLPMARADWAESHAHAFGDGTAPLCLVTGPMDDPTGMMILQRRKGAIPWLEWVGHREGRPAIFARNTCAYRALAQGIIGLGRPVDLGPCDLNSPLLSAIQDACGGRAGLAMSGSHKALRPTIALDESWADPARHIKKRDAQSIRRRSRRLAELGEVDIRIERPTPDTVMSLLRDFTDVEHRSWKAGSRSSLQADPALYQFYRDYLPRAAARGTLHSARVRLDGRTIAACLGEVRGSTYWAYKIGSDREFHKQAPGILLQYELISALAKDGIQTVELLGELDPFKRIWTETAQTCAQVHIYPYSPAGAAAATAFGTHYVWTRLKKDLLHRASPRRGPQAPATPPRPTPVSTAAE